LLISIELTINELVSVCSIDGLKVILSFKLLQSILQLLRPYVALTTVGRKK